MKLKFWVLMGCHTDLEPVLYGLYSTRKEAHEKYTELVKDDWLAFHGYEVVDVPPCPDDPGDAEASLIHMHSEIGERYGQYLLEEHTVDNAFAFICESVVGG